MTQLEPTSRGEETVPEAHIDLLLEAQIAVAWAGERGEGGQSRRLDWWDTDMVSDFGGGDLFGRLLPKTSKWAVVQAVREAARRHDARMRAKVHDPDTVVSLFRLGFVIDERADERLLELKRAPLEPKLALPGFGELIAEGWSRETFEAWARGHGDAKYEAAPAGRQLKGRPPGSLEETIRGLVGALAPLGDSYPLPHYRRPR